MRLSPLHRIRFSDLRKRDVRKGPAFVGWGGPLCGDKGGAVRAAGMFQSRQWDDDGDLPKMRSTLGTSAPSRVTWTVRS